jgi:hypothetical protein
MTRITPMHYRYKHLVVWGICGLIGLAVAEPALSAGNAFDGVYTGRRVLTKGSGRACPAEDNVSVTIRGGALTATGSAFRNFSIGFHPHRDGSFRQISTGNRGASVVIQGRVVGDVLDADITNGPCEHHWHLTKKPQ